MFLLLITIILAVNRAEEPHGGPKQLLLALPICLSTATAMAMVSSLAFRNKRSTMSGSSRLTRKRGPRHQRQELTLASRSAPGPDPRLVELVRILARRAARQWLAERVERKKADLPPH